MFGMTPFLTAIVLIITVIGLEETIRRIVAAIERVKVAKWTCKLEEATNPAKGKRPMGTIDLEIAKRNGEV